MNDTLLAAYRAAEYHVQLSRELCLRVDARHPELDEELAKQGVQRWAYLTAFNPGSRPLSADRNAQADGKLRVTLREGGIPYVNAWSQAPDGTHREEGVLAFDLDEAAAVRIGARFGQNAVVVGRVGEQAKLVPCGP